MVKSREILRRLVRRFGLLLLLTVVGATAGGVYGAVKTPTYTAKAYVVAIGDRGDSITALNFAQAYGRVATSGPVLAKAGVTLGADTKGLTDTTASTSPDAPVIEVTTTGTSPVHTATVANAVAGALVNDGNTRKADTHVGLELLAGALTPTKPTAPRPPLELLVGAAAGLLIGGLAALAGVGRGSRQESESETAEPARYEAQVDESGELDEPAVTPAEIERYMGVWRQKNPPKALTSYRATVPAQFVPDESASGELAEPVSEPVGEPVKEQAISGRIVGRAVVRGDDK